MHRGPIRPLVVLSISLVALLPAPAAASSARWDVPCAGCLTWVPLRHDPARPAPLLVVLHGDGGTPEQVAAPFRAGADRRGWLLLSPRCPRAAGCRGGSFWRWAGPPAWLGEQVDALGRSFRLDRARVYLVGWSGGASYVTWASGSLPPIFAAVGLAGGGMLPGGPCAPCRPPIVWLAGDGTPLHPLAVSSRDALRACGHAIDWRPLHGQDHEGEWAALLHGQAEAMLGFLAGRRGACAGTRSSGGPQP